MNVKNFECSATLFLRKNMSYSFSPGSPLTEFENPRRGDLNFFFFYNLKFYHVIVYTKLQAQLSQKISIFLIIKSSASPLKALKSKELFMRTDVSYQQTSKRNTPNRLIVHALTRQMQRTSQHRCETAYLSPYLEISSQRHTGLKK